MRHAARVALFALLLAALPLRGYAGVLVALCEGHHGGTGTSQEQHAHEHGDNHQHDAPGGDSGKPSQAASVCSVCASCCASAGLAAPSSLGVAFQPPGTTRIPFLARQVSGFDPDHLDRPPLAL
jgi:hypothetical protein